MANRILFFIRHGQYTASSTPPDEPDGPLTETGQEQAALTGQRLQAYPHLFQVIHHSSMQRARETAGIISQFLPGTPLQSSPLLRECIPCVPEGYESFFAHIPPAAIEGGQQQVEQVMAAFVRPLAESTEDRYEVIISHGNLINSISSQVMKAPLASWLNIDIQQCGMTEIVINAGGWARLVRHNDTGHLPPHLQAFV